MAGLPRMKDETRPRDAWMIVVCGGVERLTEALRRGDAFDEQSLHDMRALRARLGAFDAALAGREQVLNE
jgi:hypothetical protein